MATNPKTAFIIAGPTAVGKSGIAMKLAQKLQTAIISADSRQCYREMSIGTAKPIDEDLETVKHYFIDEFPVTDAISAADYEKLALGYLEDIFKVNDTAVICGGTGLYIKALCEGLDDMPPVGHNVADIVNETYREKGLPWLQAAVKSEDPQFYRTGEINNPARLLRALMFKRATGESIMDFRRALKKKRSFKYIKIGLELPRNILYTRINQRVNEMMQQGLLEEVELLYPLRSLKNLQTVGYSELFEYIDGKLTLNEAVEKIKQHSRNYAKRQLTWFRKDEEMHWFDATDNNILEKILSLAK